MRSTLHEAPLIFTRDLSLRIGNTNVCHALNWQVNPGERWAILGKNGVGKSTLLTTLAGLRRPQGGELNLCGVQIGVSPAPTFSRQAQQQIAKRRGYLAQHHSDPFSSTVLETALIGRHPHLGRWDWESARDSDIAYAALNEVDLAGLADRDVQTLSGGERQRLAIAQLLTQQPQLFLLDELTYAFKYGWLELDEVLADLAARPPMQHVIITGRAAPEKLVEAADTVTDMNLIKHAFKAGIKAMPGVEF